MKILTVYVQCERCNELIELNSAARIFYSPDINTEPDKLFICQDCSKKFQEWLNVNS